MTIFVAILGLGLLIFIHELGHFSVSLALGMRPRRFYIGFPPAVWKTTRNGIEYGLGAIPLGGFVKIPGMHMPAPVDVDTGLGRALAEAPSLSGAAGPARGSPPATTTARDAVRVLRGCSTRPRVSPHARRPRARASRTSTTRSARPRTGGRPPGSASRRSPRAGREHRARARALHLPLHDVRGKATTTVEQVTDRRPPRRWAFGPATASCRSRASGSSQGTSRG